VTREYSIPAARDLPADRLVARRQHLLSEIAGAPPRPVERPRRLGRRQLVVLAAAFAIAVGAASAFAVRNLLFGGAPSAWGGTPSWSPDGRKIAYTVYRWPDGRHEDYVMNADGSGQRNLTKTWGLDVSPIWSPDWRRILFLRNPCSGVRDACKSVTQIYRMNADGTGRRRLARGVTYRQNSSGQRTSEHSAIPTWSPDGRKIAFVSDRTGSAEVYVMNADGSGQRRLTQHAKPKELAWSPDGRMLAFGSHAVGGPRDVYVMNANGTGLRNLTPGPGGGEALSWSPDGRKIGFRSLRDGSGEIYVVNVDGTGLRRLTQLTRNPVSSGGTTFSAPVWSPDGHKILFVRSGWGHGLTNSEIFVMNADGSRQRNLTRNPAPDDDPVWSPDGRKILFVSKRDGYGEVYVMNANGSGPRNLTQLRGGS
jgi:Tol biopolymer transport system component